jgi:hypothetical protein
MNRALTRRGSCCVGECFAYLMFCAVLHNPPLSTNL